MCARGGGEGVEVRGGCFFVKGVREGGQGGQWSSLHAVQ